LCDGGIGALVQAMSLSVAGDFQGHENCTSAIVLLDPQAKYFSVSQ